MKSLSQNDVARFWGKVSKEKSTTFYNGERCWEWTASKTTEGYGGIKIEGASLRASRVAWMLTYGEIPKGLLVCHKCDNPPCCNPSHLFLGTNQDNATDKIRKGRQFVLPIMRRENHPEHKLTDAQVLEIRSRYFAGGEKQKDLAREFGVCQQHISFLVKREGHKNYARGEERPTHKLTAVQVEEMRRRYAAGEETIYRLAKAFGVVWTTAYKIVKNKMWRS